MTSKHGKLDKYFDFLREGNAITARLENKIITEQTAITLFANLISNLATRLEEEK